MIQLTFMVAKRAATATAFFAALAMPPSIDAALSFNAEANGGPKAAHRNAAIAALQSSIILGREI